jgi:D-alanine-D-alanine ligase
VYPKLWEAPGVPFPELCDRLLALALERFRAERAGHASSARVLRARTA